MRPLYHEINNQIEVFTKENNLLPPHLHQYVEYIYVTSGHLLLRIEDRQIEMEPRDLAVIFPDVIHGFDVNPSLPSQAIYALKPLSPADPFKESSGNAARSPRLFQRICFLRTSHTLFMPCSPPGKAPLVWSCSKHISRFCWQKHFPSAIWPKKRAGIFRPYLAGYLPHLRSLYGRGQPLRYGPPAGCQPLQAVPALLRSPAYELQSIFK